MLSSMSFFSKDFFFLRDLKQFELLIHPHHFNAMGSLSQHPGLHSFKFSKYIISAQFSHLQGFLVIHYPEFETQSGW